MRRIQTALMADNAPRIIILMNVLIVIQIVVVSVLLTWYVLAISAHGSLLMNVDILWFYLKDGSHGNDQGF